MWRLYKCHTLENCLVQNSLWYVPDSPLTWEMMSREVSICQVHIIMAIWLVRLWSAPVSFVLAELSSWDHCIIPTGCDLLDVEELMGDKTRQKRECEGWGEEVGRSKKIKEVKEERTHTNNVTGEKLPNTTKHRSFERYAWCEGSILLSYTASHVLTMPTGGASLSQMNMILVTRGSPFMSLQGVPPPITTS